MLVGYSLEVCLKAMLIIRKGADGYAEGERQHHHHRLDKLADFIPDLSERDREILRALSHYVGWAGRYPDPGFRKEGQASESFSIAERHRVTAGDLFKLAARIMAHTQTVLVAEK